jgi:hypothetical protein
MTSDTTTTTDRLLAALGLGFRILVWLLLLPLCAVWVLLATIFDTVRRPQARRA